MINKVILLGFVGGNPEIREAKDSKVASFSLATSESYKDKNSQKKTNTQWHKIVVWGGLAGIAEKYISKGSRLYIDGKIRYREYEKDGQKKYYTEIQAQTIQLLGGKAHDQAEPVQDTYTQTDDLPF